MNFPSVRGLGSDDKSQSVLKFTFRGGEIPVIAKGNIGQNGVGLGNAGIQAQSIFRCLPGLGFGVGRGQVVVRHLSEKGVGAGEAGIREGVTGIVLDGALIRFDTLVKVATIGPVKAAAKVVVVGRGIDDTRGAVGSVNT